MRCSTCFICIDWRGKGWPMVACPFRALVVLLPSWTYPVRWIRRTSVDKETYKTGVPQCSILCSFSFVIYMNDIETVSKRINLYAICWWYDTKTHVMCINPGGKSWCKPYVIFDQSRTVWNLLQLTNSLNDDKTKFMIFHNHQKWYRHTISLV